MSLVHVGPGFVIPTAPFTKNLSHISLTLKIYRNSLYVVFSHSWPRNHYIFYTYHDTIAVVTSAQSIMIHLLKFRWEWYGIAMEFESVIGIIDWIAHPVCPFGGCFTIIFFFPTQVGLNFLYCSKFWQVGHKNIHMTPQPGCHGICKIVSLPDRIWLI